MKLSAYLLLIVFLVFTSCKKEVKTTKETVEQDGNNEADVSAIDFKTKIAEKNVQLVDVRTALEYNQGHIKNATLIDFNNADFIKNATDVLDKSKPVYLYCLAGGKRSQISVNLLKEKGYNVYNLKGGLANWQKKGFKTVKPEGKTEEENKPKNTEKITTATIIESVIPIKEVTTKKEAKEVKEIIEIVQNKDKTTAVNKEVKKEIVKAVKLTPEIIKVNTATFKNKIDGKDVQLIDVRTPKEYNESYIKNAKNINIYDADFILQTKDLDKSKPVYVYCRSGVRSMKAANKLKDAGFKVYNLNGGIKAWQKDGNKTEK